MKQYIITEAQLAKIKDLEGALNAIPLLRAYVADLCADIEKQETEDKK